MPNDQQQVCTKAFAEKMAKQNDFFRRSVFLQFTDPTIPQGKIVCTDGISARGPEFVSILLRNLYIFNNPELVRTEEAQGFTEECDPNGWHDMGILSIGDETVWFKIDYYDLNYEYGAEDPSDLSKTRRVLTLMFPDEY